MNLSIKSIKLKLNISILFTILFISTFIYYHGDTYISNILEGTNNNIIALDINNPFSTSEKDTIDNVENINKTEPTKESISSSWHWPTTSNYTITTYYSSYHKALDIYSYDGYNSSIYAVNNGEIIEIKDGCLPGDVSCNGKGGNYIVIKHTTSNYYTVYMHLNKINVKVGDIVSSGDVIASMGNTGNVIPIPTSTNPYGGTHLHFCLYIGRPFQGGYPINPLSIY